MHKEIYIIWNIRENRPVIMSDNYGAMCCFMSKENAKAFLDDCGVTNFTIKKFKATE